jgi:hypothetical protein
MGSLRTTLLIAVSTKYDIFFIATLYFLFFVVVHVVPGYQKLSWSKVVMDWQTPVSTYSYDDSFGTNDWSTSTFSMSQPAYLKFDI